jgi:hypothetical protein
LFTEGREVASHAGAGQPLAGGPAQTRINAGWRTVWAAACLALCACQPALNWREVRIANASASVMLPCKPDKSARNVPLGGQEVAMQLLSCDAAGATYAVAWAQLPAGASAPIALEQWRRITLAHLNAKEIAPLTAPTPGSIAARGTRPGGGAVVFAARWVPHVQQLVHMAIYVDNPGGQPAQAMLKTEMHEPFFDGLRFRP